MLSLLKKRLWPAILIICLAIAPSTVFAQSNPSTFEITSIDQSNFPDNSFYFFAYNANGLPIPDLTKSDIRVIEDQELVDFSLLEETIGVRVVFVIDAGMGINSIGSTGITRYSEMKNFISGFVKKMDVASSVSVVSFENGQYKIISDFGNRVDVINERMESYTPNPNAYSNGINAISIALSELANVNDERKEFIVLLSPGLELQPVESFSTYSEQIKTPKSPFVYTVLFRRDEGGMSSRLIEVASIGNGHFLYYTPEAKDNLDSFFNHILEWQNQYKVTYRIPNFFSGSHEISLLNDAQSIRISTSYNLDISEPVVTIIEPSNNQTLNQSSAEKLFVKIEVTFPDNLKRKIKSVVLTVDGKPVTTITDLKDTKLEIPWESNLVEISETTPLQLDVEITDELGLSSKSYPVQIILNPELRPDLTRKMTPLSLGLQIGALVLAMASVVLVIIFRRQIANAGGAMITKATDFIEIITKPRRDLIAKAYMEVLAGVESTGKIEIYGTTPIGRSKKYADLVFHAGEENSPISNLHCTILDEEDVFFIRDEQSTWGTFLNQNKLSPLEKYQLHDGDEIFLAPVERGGIKLKYSKLESVYTYDDNLHTPSVLENTSFQSTNEDFNEDISTKPTRRPFLD